MIHKSASEQLLKEYEEKSAVILKEMMQILLRTQRKRDDKSYAHVLEKVEKGE